MVQLLCYPRRSETPLPPVQTLLHHLGPQSTLELWSLPVYVQKTPLSGGGGTLGHGLPLI